VGGWLLVLLAPTLTLDGAATAGAEVASALAAGAARPAWLALAGLVAMAGGAGLALMALRLAGRAAPRTSYRERRWGWRDSLVAAACAPPIAAALWLPLWYSPYPRLTLPGFEPLLGAALLGLLGPALAASRR
jgi:hypothetical protein